MLIGLCVARIALPLAALKLEVYKFIIQVIIDVARIALPLAALKPLPSPSCVVLQTCRAYSIAACGIIKRPLQSAILLLHGLFSYVDLRFQTGS